MESPLSKPWGLLRMLFFQVTGLLLEFFLVNNKRMASEIPTNMLNPLLYNILDLVVCNIPCILHTPPFGVLFNILCLLHSPPYRVIKYNCALVICGLLKITKILTIKESHF